MQRDTDGDGLTLRSLLLLALTCGQRKSGLLRERMRPQLDGIRLALSTLLLVICFRGDTQGHAIKCSPAVRVHRNTEFTAVAKASLKIICPVQHCGLTLNVTWCKVDMDNCIPVNKTDGITDGWEKNEGQLDSWFLLFGNVNLDDAGHYRCGLSGSVTSVSHSINVIIAATNYGNINNNSNTTDRSLQEEDDDQGLIWLPYIFICAGTMSVIVMAMAISFLFIYGCKRSERSRKADPTNLQYEAPKIYNASPRPDLPASRLPHIRHATPSGALPIRTNMDNQAAIGMDSSSTHDNEKYITYASLNHQAPKKSPTCTDISREEFSEYAAIRVS
ncbi:hypothetical protein AAFF_G00019820 [Aldrovandia affinis]|uniref:Ig-like domain-containing protein n=1 Tax=Aldrovandia affinis TaxID=143900 RepID=A0AAD7WH43_9TELE|nr:hypothetical protein AAFF_G00019820 [Aldrovandia affinis]